MKRGLLIKRSDDQKTLQVQLVELNKDESELAQIYRLLDVQLIDIVSYKKKSIYVDDEGLCVSNPQLTMILQDTNQNLYGNILVLGDCDDSGETQGISLEDVYSLIKELKIKRSILTQEDLIVW